MKDFLTIWIFMKWTKGILDEAFQAVKTRCWREKSQQLFGAVSSNYKCKSREKLFINFEARNGIVISSNGNRFEYQPCMQNKLCNSQANQISLIVMRFLLEWTPPLINWCSWTSLNSNWFLLFHFFIKITDKQRTPICCYWLLTFCETLGN